MIVPSLYRLPYIAPLDLYRIPYRMGVFFEDRVILIVFPYISFLMKLIMYCSVLCDLYSILC